MGVQASQYNGHIGKICISSNDTRAMVVNDREAWADGKDLNASHNFCGSLPSLHVLVVISKYSCNFWHAWGLGRAQRTFRTSVQNQVELIERKKEPRLSYSWPCCCCPNLKPAQKRKTAGAIPQRTNNAKLDTVSGLIFRLSSGFSHPSAISIGISARSFFPSRPIWRMKNKPKPNKTLWRIMKKACTNEPTSTNLSYSMSNATMRNGCVIWKAVMRQGVLSRIIVIGIHVDSDPVTGAWIVLGWWLLAMLSKS